ncbi:MAG: Do family serine endopeptidase [Pseudomonadota bacterium]|nr:Do family serine endopeptidase [Pseudomonadota bacterium]
MNTIELKSKKLVLALLAAGVLGGVGATAVGRLQAPALAQPAAAVPVAASAAATLPGFAPIAAKVGPAVVNISVSGTRRVSMDEEEGAPARQRGSAPDAQMQDFLRRFGLPPGMFGQVPGQPGGAPELTRGQGSGFIVSEDGLILTNAHVVRGAQEVNVKLTDRREFRATVLGSDDKTDVAVLKIDATGLPTVALGSSAALQPGEWVLAIGSPFGFESTVTAGVVSAKGRSLPDDSAVPFIQSDVAVNPGNSGGPLLNARGEVVGINSQIYSRSGGFQGVSFAIPIELATHIQQQLVAHGKVDHARLGVTVQEVNQAFADSFNLPRPEGALVARVEPGGPADKAGLKAGDVILRVDGQPVVASGDLPARIGMAKPGDSLRLDIWRQGKPEQLTAQLGSANAKGAQVADASAAAPQGRLGLALRPLQADEQRAAKVAGGLVVEQAGGAAARAGVQPGDVLVSVNGQPVKDVAQVRSIVAKADKSVALLVQRGDEQIFVPVRVG